MNGVVVSEMMCEWLTVVGGWHVPTGDDYDGNGKDERTSKRAEEEEARTNGDVD